MDAIELFKNPEFGEVRVVEVDNEPYFVGKDIAEILGYKNPSKAIKDHCDKDNYKVLTYKALNKTLLTSLWSGNDYSNKVIINEFGVYELILGSELPSAKSFRKWVTSEVLPSIRKNGAYMTEKTLANRMKELEIEEMKARKGIADSFRELMNIETLSPSWKQILAAKSAEVLSGGEKILPLPKSEVSYSATDIAKELGTSSTMVGRIAKANNLKTKEYGEWYHDKSKYSSKEVDVFRYNQKGFDIIKNIFFNRFG